MPRRALLCTSLALFTAAGCAVVPDSRRLSDAEQKNWQSVHLRWWETTCPGEDWSPMYYRMRVVDAADFQYQVVADEAYGNMLLVGKRHLGDRPVVMAGFAEACSEA